MSVEKWSRKQRAAFQRTIAARATKRDAVGKKALKLLKAYFKQAKRLIELETKGRWGKR